MQSEMANVAPVSCLFVCMFVSPLTYLKNQTSNFHQIFCTLPVALARSCSGGNAICCVLRVLWMMSHVFT